MNYSIAEVIEAVGRSFHSIDIRVVATQEDGRWTAEVLVIRLSYESVEAATERLRQVEASEAERVETSEFWIASRHDHLMNGRSWSVSSESAYCQ